MNGGTRLIFVSFLVLTGCISSAPGVVEQGHQAAEAERWFDAYDSFCKAIELNPNDLELRRQRVRAAHRSGQLPDLEEFLREQISDRDDARASYELALVVATAGEPGSDRRAIEMLEALIPRIPEDPEIHFRIGLIRLEQEQFEQARQSLSQALEMDHDCVRYRVALAGALAQIPGNDETVRQTLAALPELDPNEQDIARARAILAGLNNPLNKIPESLRRTYIDALAVLSEESTSSGEAVQLIEEALTYAPGCQPFIVLNGLASVRLGQLGRARGAFLRAIELWPGDPVPYIELAALDMEIERFSDAEENLESALRADPLSEHAWAELGRLRYQRRNYDEAAEAFQRLVTLDGGRTMSYLWLGRAFRRAGRDEEAERVYLSMVDRNPETFEAFLQLGHIYRRRRINNPGGPNSEELTRQARHYYERALEQRPQDPLVQRLLENLENPASDDD